MKTYEIIRNGETIDRIEANDNRHALCIYLTKHPEMEDMMLWKDAFYGVWRLAEYDHEDENMIAREVKTVNAISDEMKQAILDRAT